MDDEEVNAVSVCALMHDVEEIWTGDIPSPHKELMAKRGAEDDTRTPTRHHGAADRSAHDGGTVEPPWNTGTERTEALVRAGDLIDAYHWSSMFVLDQWVKDDCQIRIHKFMTKCNPNLGIAMTKMLFELGLK